MLSSFSFLVGQIQLGEDKQPRLVMCRKVIWFHVWKEAFQRGFLYFLHTFLLNCLAAKMNGVADKYPVVQKKWWPGSVFNQEVFGEKSVFRWLRGASSPWLLTLWLAEGVKHRTHQSHDFTPCFHDDALLHFAVGFSVKMIKRRYLSLTQHAGASHSGTDASRQWGQTGVFKSTLHLILSLRVTLEWFWLTCLCGPTESTQAMEGK